MSLFKKTTQDVRKSLQKLSDHKKDSASKIKHLKIVVDNMSHADAKQYFEQNFSMVYFLLFDIFTHAESNLRLRGNKAGREDLDGVFFVLEKLLCLVPEIIHRKCNMHSIMRMFSKLLHRGNSYKLRTDAIRYFILFYQCLGDNASPEIHRAFATLVPGLPGPTLPTVPEGGTLIRLTDEYDFDEMMQHPNFASTRPAKRVHLDAEYAPSTSQGATARSSEKKISTESEETPLMPPGKDEKPPEDETKYYLELILDLMPKSVMKIYWADWSRTRALNSYGFLQSQFITYYLKVICPDFRQESVNEAYLELGRGHTVRNDDCVASRVILVKWLTTCLSEARTAEPMPGPSTSVLSMSAGESYVTALAATPSRPVDPSQMVSPPVPVPFMSAAPTVSSQLLTASPYPADGDQTFSAQAQGLKVKRKILEREPPADVVYAYDTSPANIVRDVLFSSKENVNITIEVLRQAFLLPFSEAAAIRKVLSLYKEWIQKTVSIPPVFLEESTSEDAVQTSQELPARSTLSEESTCAVCGYSTCTAKHIFTGSKPILDQSRYAYRPDRVVLIRQNILQVFMTQATNVFLAKQVFTSPLGHSASDKRLLAEQTDVCKRVLNLYRYMVMHRAMDRATWEQLLYVLLQITSLVVTKPPPKMKEVTLGGDLAPAIFQTLIVTWIKANLNIIVKDTLWDNFLRVLSNLTDWEDLIREWAKTMETLTRVLARHVYNLDLSELKDEETTGHRFVKGFPGIITRRQRPHKSMQAVSTSKVLSGLSIRRPAKETAVSVSIRARAHSLDRPELRRLGETEDDDAEFNLDAIKRSASLNDLAAKAACGRTSENPTRTPSPTASTGVESTSIKDSANSYAALERNELQGQEHERGILFGGTARGWLPDVAAVMWRRMLGALGNINNIKDPTLHEHVYHYLIHLNSKLVLIWRNQSVTDQFQMQVPFDLVAGWCIEAQLLPSSHWPGRVVALQLLCQLVQAPVSTGHEPGHYKPTDLYFHILHEALRKPKNENVNEAKHLIDVIIRHAATKYLSLAIDGHTLLLLDFLNGAYIVLNSSDLTSPRKEAVQFLGSLLSLPASLLLTPQLSPYEDSPLAIVEQAEIKEKAIRVLWHACRKEPTSSARIAAIECLGALCYQMMVEKSNSPYFIESLNLILQCLYMDSKGISKAASDVLLALADLTEQMLILHKHVVEKILRISCTRLYELRHSYEEEDSRALSGNLILAIAEFVIRTPLEYLKTIKITKTQQPIKESTLLTIFKVLCIIMDNSQPLEDIEQYHLAEDEHFNSSVKMDDSTIKPLFLTYEDLQICAQTVCKQLLQHLGQFPSNASGQISSIVCETDDGGSTKFDEAVLSAPDAQYLTVGSSTLATIKELPSTRARTLTISSGESDSGDSTSDKQVRVLLRDEVAKSCWDASSLYYDCQENLPELPNPVPTLEEPSDSREHILADISQPFPLDQMPDHDNRTPDQHQLDQLLKYIGHTSPEVMCYNRPLDEPAMSPLPPSIEEETISTLLQHKNAEEDLAKDISTVLNLTYTLPSEDTAAGEAQKSGLRNFEMCKRFMTEFGSFGWDQRQSMYLASRSDRLVRDMKHLDKKISRETHKIAVIYVGKGQEDRRTILSNTSGSPAFEEFVSALGWEVELNGHDGYMGGLSTGGSCGTSAPYISTITYEAIFHVSTRMPSDGPDDIFNKTKHLGNDEVHVVWSEHCKPYRRDTIPTQFCDILIVLYPLPMGLISCVISHKPGIPTFGPLPSEIVLPILSVAGLVRAVAICGGRVKRTTLPNYKHIYSERFKDVCTVVKENRETSTFESFVERILEPHPSKKNSQPEPEPGPSDAYKTKKSIGKLSSNLAALLDQGVTSTQASTSDPHISPRPTKRLGHFKRPQLIPHTHQASTSGAAHAQPGPSALMSHTAEPPPSPPMTMVSKKKKVDKKYSKN